MKKFIYLIGLAGALIFISSCAKYDVNPEPVAKISIQKNTYNVMENVSVKNNGSGEYFSYWPGDAGHNYAKRANGIDKGLVPNIGKDFDYSYLFTGTYTIVVVASSFDESTNTRTEKVDSVKVTIVSGNSGNVIESIELYNCLKNYNAVGKFVGEDSILFPIDFYNRANFISDSSYINIINNRNFIFSASLFARVYGENNTLLTGMTDDTYKSNLIVPVSYHPLNYSSTVSELKVVGQDNSTRTYKIAAMFYPEMFSFTAKNALNGKEYKAIKYSSNGLTVDNDSLNFISAYSDSVYYSVRIKSLESEFDIIPTFTITPGSTITLNGVEQVSGTSTVHVAKNKALNYIITRNEKGFKLSTSIAVYIK